MADSPSAPPSADEEAFAAILGSHARRMQKAKTRLRDLLRETLIEEAAPRAHPVILRATATVAQALHVLAEHGILSAPVCRAEPRELEPEVSEEEYSAAEPPPALLGFVSVSELMAVYMNAVAPAHFEDGAMETGALVAELAQYAHDLEQRAIVDAVPSLRPQPPGSPGGGGAAPPPRHFGGDGGVLSSVGPADSLATLLRDGFYERHRSAAAASRDADACAVASKAHVRSVHRVALLDGERLRGTVSQSDVIRVMAADRSKIEDVAAESLQSLGFTQPAHDDALGDSYLVCVRGSCPVIRVMRRLMDEGLSAVGVVDDATGALVGNFSASDFRGIEGGSQFDSLALPIRDFLALKHGRARGSGAEKRFAWPHPEAGEDASMPAVLALPASAGLWDVLTLMTRHHVHRIYVIDDRKRPVGVVTQSDVLSMAYLHVSLPDTPVSLIRKASFRLTGGSVPGSPAPARVGSNPLAHSP